MNSSRDENERDRSPFFSLDLIILEMDFLCAFIPALGVPLLYRKGDKICFDEFDDREWMTGRDEPVSHYGATESTTQKEPQKTTK